jgi:hypothetical protein
MAHVTAQTAWGGPEWGKVEGICLDHSRSGARIRFIHKPTLLKELMPLSAGLGISCDAPLVRQDVDDASILFLSAAPSGSFRLGIRDK